MATIDQENVSAGEAVAGQRAELPLACSLTAAELGVRVEENGGLFARASDVHELPDGYRFVFPAEIDDALRLLRFVLAERACCPFFTFELTFPSPHCAIHLTVCGREGVKEIVKASVAAAAIARSRDGASRIVT